MFLTTNPDPNSASLFYQVEKDKKQTSKKTDFMKILAIGRVLQIQRSEYLSTVVFTLNFYRDKLANYKRGDLWL